MSRIDFLSAGQQPPPAAPVKIPINTVVFERVETANHPAGQPDFAPTPLTGADVVISERPCQTVVHTDEYGKPSAHTIHYAEGAIRGADLVDNCSKERVAVLLKPDRPAFAGEPGVVVRTGMKAAALTDLTMKIARGLSVPAGITDMLQAESERTSRLLALVQAAKAKLSSANN